jgi:hypothetical protein
MRPRLALRLACVRSAADPIGLLTPVPPVTPNSLQLIGPARNGLLTA